MKVVFPKVEEELLNFMNRCKLKDFEFVLFPHCCFIFDKDVAKDLEKINPYQSKKGG